MPPPTYLHSAAQLARAAAPRPGCSRTACFSTTALLRATAPASKKKGQAPAPKKGIRVLNIKKGKPAPSRDLSRRPASGERRAARKRIVLSNDNALEVTALQDLTRANVLGEQVHGRVVGLPVAVVDALRAVDAFKTHQGWSLFRRPAVLMRSETAHMASLFRDVEASLTGADKKTMRRILSGERLSGKSTLLLQALAMGFLRDWVVISLPEAQDLVNAHTEYAPVPDSEPMQYTQSAYTAALLRQILESHEKKGSGNFLASTALATAPQLPLQLPKSATLKDLIALGVANPDASWPVFVALWEELSQPGRPPVLLAADGLAHLMRHSDYLSADVQRIHAFDLTLVRHFIDYLSGHKQLPNGGIVLGATSASNAPSSPALDFCIEAAEARQRTPDNVPQWNPYQKLDLRVMEALKGLNSADDAFDVVNVGGLSKAEARTVMEYYAESGMLRHRVNDSFVTEKWSLAGMGNVGELERASVRARI